MDQKREERIRNQARLAYQGSSYYRELYDSKEISLLDCGIESLPFVTQRDLIEAGKRFRNTETPIFRISASSGTTRHPKTVYRTKRDFDISVEVMEQMMKKTGISKEDIVYIGQPFDLASFGYLVLEACKSIGAMAVPGGLGQSDERMLELIRWNQADIIMSSPSRMKNLMRLLEREGVEAREELISNVRMIIVAGEPLRSFEREQLREYWHCEICDYYGSEETDSLGYSVENGYIQLMEDYFEFEFLPVEGSDKKELALTSLYLEGSPLIRYRLGDLVEVNEKGQVRIIGKTWDVLYLYDGVKLYAFQVEEAIQSVIASPFRFQIRCKNTEGADEAEILVETEEKCDFGKAELEKEIEEAVWESSLDLQVCRDIGSVRFSVKLNTGGIEMTRRGKTPRIIDERR